MLVDALARTPGTLLHRKLADDDWTLDQHLLALVVDRLSQANWQRQGKKGSPRPKPISPLAKQKTGQRVGDAGERTPEQTAMVLALYRTGAFDHGG